MRKYVHCIRQLEMTRKRLYVFTFKGWRMEHTQNKKIGHSQNVACKTNCLRTCFFFMRKTRKNVKIRT